MQLAYVLRVDDGYAIRNTIEELVEAWKQFKSDPRGFEVAFVRTVHYDCINVEECYRIFEEYRNR